MRRFLGKKTVVGLDFDTGAIRGVEMEKKNDEFLILSSAQVELPQEAFQEGQIHNPDIILKALKKLWEKGKFRTRDVILGISNQHILIRFANFPQVPLSRLDTLVHFQAQEHLPVPLETVELDYDVLGSRLDGEKTQLELILVAGNKVMLKNFLQVLEEANLNPLEMEVIPLSLLRFLNKEKAEKSVAILNVGKGLTNMILAEKQIPRMARIMPINWETAKTTEKDGINILVSELSRNIRSTIGFYQSNRNTKPVEKILICGSKEVVADLKIFLEQEIGLPTYLLNPLKALNIKNSKDHPAVTGEYGLAMSFAIRGWE